jgi:hypothetical protein
VTRQLTLAEFLWPPAQVTSLPPTITRASILQEAADPPRAYPAIRMEFLQPMDVLDGSLDHLLARLTTHVDSLLQAHARHVPMEILAALGVNEGAKIAAGQSGVYEPRRAHAELHAFTRDKSSGRFSPTAGFADYALGRALVHWESRSIMRAESATGLRCRNHERDDGKQGARDRERSTPGPLPHGIIANVAATGSANGRRLDRGCSHDGHG